ncbi:hypothetical protein TrCOL_g1944 [Triparma columacea]|uniref:Fe2OG dioxygenase domain-containing protein n=1 Tax=Triparma columacea TaxID=722753 RepID=A0A9W7G3Q6_9STRA|nr:hypothetical protein TrCOL_g1944 [Triparma columacea]
MSRKKKFGEREKVDTINTGKYRLGALAFLIIAVAMSRYKSFNLIGGILGGMDKPLPKSPILPTLDQWAPSLEDIEAAGTLHPSDIPPLPVFGDYSNETVIINGRFLQVAEGRVDHKGLLGGAAERAQSYFSVIPEFATPAEVEQILAILNDPDAVQFDEDPDTVDGMASHELYVDTVDFERGGRVTSSLKRDSTKEGMEERKEIRSKLKAIMDNVQDRLTQYVRFTYPSSPSLTPCYSLVRRYRSGERQTHDVHRDWNAKVTAVVSLSEYGEEYRGGLYVARSRSERMVVALGRGDTLVHDTSLLHGVKVEDDGPSSTRWSWIIWFRDSEKCADNSKEWFKDCPPDDAVCLSMYADSGAGGDKVEMIRLHHEAAKMGLSTSMVKLARAYLNQLPSHLPLDLKKAADLYREAAARANEPDAIYGLAQLTLQGFVRQRDDTKMGHLLQEVAALLERAANANHQYAMFNLGVMHRYGYAAAWGGEKDAKLAAEWFENSGLPEGYYAASTYYSSIGDNERSKKLMSRAKRMGYGTEWRKRARIAVGSGGAGGVDINMAWPPFFQTGVVPDKF